MEVKLKLTKEEHKDLVSFCNLNDLLISSVVKDSFTTGFNIERYGLLNSVTSKDKQVEKEVIVEKRVEVPVEIIKEVVKIEYVEIEKPVEVIKEVVVEKLVEIVKEVPVEKVVEKIVKVSDDTQVNELLLKIQQLENQPPKIVEVLKQVFVEKNNEGDFKPKLDALQNTIMKLKQDNIDKDKKIQEQQQKIDSLIQSDLQKGAVYLKGSNFDDKLYK